MKQGWQDRGEVQDSDEEGLSIGTDSQSPERPRKRIRICNENDVNDVSEQRLLETLPSKQVGAGDDENGWMAAKPATYGRRAETSALEIGAATQAGPDKQPTPPAGKGSTLSDPREHDGESEQLSTSSQPSESGHLPDAADLFTRMPSESATSENIPIDGQTSGASSPLSSPLDSPPPVFWFPRAFESTGARQEGDEVALEQDANQLECTTAQLRRIADTHQPARRELRARKDIQLHPYLFDKAQYQKQFRERGLRTVRVVESNGVAAETQGAYSSDNEDDTQSTLQCQPSILAGLSSELREDSSELETARPTDQPEPSSSEDELPDLSAILKRSVANGVRIGQKRRKLAHTHHRREVCTVVVPQAPIPYDVSQVDDFAVPPSPPPTSSDWNRPPIAGQGVPRFRLPRGCLPAPLPTPQISSETRPTRFDRTNAPSDVDGSPPRRTRPPTLWRQAREAVLIDCSTESETGSESETSLELDERRLQRERRRIKGVLPASWLKIDLQARRRQLTRSPTRERRLSTESPPPTVPQKGIAQRVTHRNSGTPGARGALVITDDDGESDASAEASSAPYLRQASLHFSAERSKIASSETLDDEMVEVDWIDPMLAGSSRKNPSTKRSKKRQPRITDALKPARRSAIDLSEEHVARRKLTGSREASKTKQRASRRSHTSKARVPKRSIIDAPASPNATPLPQFVRLAARQARNRPDGGRHTPSRKTIRLATARDTEDAEATVNAWREGTIVQRDWRPISESGKDIDNSIRSEVDVPSASLGTRLPLFEIANSQQQLRLSSPVRKKGSNHVKRSTVTALVRRPGLHQARLHPVVLAPDAEAPARRATRTLVAGGIPASRRRRPLLQAPRFRDAQLQTLEDEFDSGNRQAAFERRMHCLAEAVAQKCRRQPTPGLQLSRFTTDQGALGRAWAVEAQDQHTEPENNILGNRLKAHRSRKNLPRRLDAEAREYRQPSEPLPGSASSDEPPDHTIAGPQGPMLRGLGPFGTRYPTDFDIRPLQLGTYLHESTFIGSGDFAESLTLAGRNLDVSAGRIRIYVDGEALEWSAWTEEVATGLSRIPQAVIAALRTLDHITDAVQRSEQLTVVMSNIDHMLRSTIRYCSKCLSFLDHVDRRNCVRSLLRFARDLQETYAEAAAEDPALHPVLVRIAQYSLVLARQASQVADHPLVQAEARVQCQGLMTRAAFRLAGMIRQGGFEALRTFYEENRHSSKREAGVRDDTWAVSSLVLLNHTLSGAQGVNSSFWAALKDFLAVDSAKSTTVSALDRIWYDVFTILPVLEIDSSGIAHVGSRFGQSEDGWEIVKQLIECVLQLYLATASMRDSTANDYVRATISRCYCLLTRWGWWRCESILGTIFDFFAKRGLALLEKEEARGSPRYLQELGDKPSLELQPEDRSFHVFLKMLAIGLQDMRKHRLYSDRKIGGIAWRFIPNHGRTYRKDAAVQQADLEALRNHHDLLCTLYYASPPGQRLRVELLRNLVDHSNSHREACRISVRAWSNLASFQSSISEGDDALPPFVAWHNDMTVTTKAQYSLARSEAEQQFAIAKAQGVGAVTEELLERTIASNERPVAATLVDLLAAFKRSLESTSNLSVATYLVRETAAWKVIDAFDPAQRRLNGMLYEGLAAVNLALKVHQKLLPQNESQQSSDESQDYGDSSALQEFATSKGDTRAPASDIPMLLQEPMGHLLSNIFGSESHVDDSMLTMIVDTWVQLACCLVVNGTTNWISHIEGYNSAAWSQLRQTAQRRKLTPYFMARIVEASGPHFDAIKNSVLSAWLKSLVDREANLKYQHNLTSALLNHYIAPRMLDNLPFSKVAKADRFDISLHNFRQRRLSLISSILSNVREAYDEALYERSGAAQDLRRTYVDMLRQMMQTMKANYQDLQASSNAQIADVGAQGSYVEFVQQVVSFLQQYTADICPVDRFFTDSAAFPLPATDPTYVVGRVRSYIPKLADSRTRKQLAVFIQTVSERAAIDVQQPYLVNQLSSAITGVLERGNLETPSLRHVLLTSVFPAYIKTGLSAAASCILALPILQVSAYVIRDMLYDIKFEDASSVAATSESVLSILEHLALPVKEALAHPELLQLPHVEKTIAAVFDVARSSVTVTLHIEKVTGHAAASIESLSLLHRLALSVQDAIRGEDTLFDLDPTPDIVPSTGPWPDTAAFAERQVLDAASDWHAEDGRLFIRRGNMSREVVMAMKDDEEEEERGRLHKAIETFCTAYVRVHRPRARHLLSSRWSGVGGVVV